MRKLLAAVAGIFLAVLLFYVFTVDTTSAGEILITSEQESYSTSTIGNLGAVFYITSPIDDEITIEIVDGMTGIQSANVLEADGVRNLEILNGSLTELVSVKTNETIAVRMTFERKQEVGQGNFTTRVISEKRNTGTIVTGFEINEPDIVERGRAHETYDNGDGTFTFRTGIEVWTYDESSGEYVPHVVEVFNESYVEVKSGVIGWKIGEGTAFITDPNVSTNVARESWETIVDGNALEKTFASQELIDNSSGVFVTNSYDISYLYADASMYVTYAIYDGRPTERIVKVSGLPESVTQSTTIERRWESMDADAIYVNEELFESIVGYSSSGFVEQDGNKASLKFLNNGSLVVHENLKTSGDKLKEIRYDSDGAVFVYSGWVDGDIFLIDDTFSENNPTEDGLVRTPNTQSTSCSTGTKTKSTDVDFMGANIPPSNQDNSCARGYVEWSISSIPDNADVSNTVFKGEVSLVSNAANCDYMPMTSQPSATSANNVWTDIGDGTAYLSNNNACTTTGTDKSLDLGSSADTDVENMLSSNWFALGVKATSETRTSGVDRIMYWASEDDAGATPKPTLEITYTACSSYRTPSGGAYNATWGSACGTTTVKSGDAYSWTWRTYSAGSGRKTPQGEAYSWTWTAE